MINTTLYLTLLGCLCCQLVASPEIVLYISKEGNDHWSGTLEKPNPNRTDGPLATLNGAKNKIRQIKKEQNCPQQPIRVLIREGTYFLEEPFVLTPEDSGSWDAPISYEAFPGEKPILSGGIEISNWCTEDKMWIAELTSYNNLPDTFYALWVNGELMRPARSPNEGFFYTAGKAPSLTDPTTGAEIDRSKTAFVYKPGDIQKWKNLEDIIITVYHSWDVSYSRVAEIDENNNIVSFKQPVTWPFEYWGPKQRYFVENFMEALDAPGEWYFDKDKHLLYYLPRDSETIETTNIVIPRLQNLIRLEGDIGNEKYIEYIRFCGLTFEHTNFTIPSNGLPDEQAAYSVDAAIQATGVLHCSIENCVIRHISNYGIWFFQGCRHNRIQKNHIHDLGAGGIRIGSGNNPETSSAITSWNTVDNNWIHDGGKIFPAAVGIWIGRSSYNTISHNEISDLYYTGISVGWSWGYQPSSANHNIIEFNHIHHIGKGVLSDMGGIYTLGIAPGTILRNNLIHDVYSFSYGGWGIYPDEGSSDLLIENNVVYNTKTGGFHQHYGKENRVQNNIFAFALEGQIQRSREEEHISFFFERNIIYYDCGKLFSGTWVNGNFYLDRNCYWNPNHTDLDFVGHSFQEWRAKGFDRNSIITDPLFIDPANFDFRLKPDSPVFFLGFRPIDTSTIGLYGDEEWVQGPKKLKRNEENFFSKKEPPREICDNFESAVLGDIPDKAVVVEEGTKGLIRVTDETAAEGKQALKIQDAHGLTHVHNPYFFYAPHWNKGIVSVKFAIRLEQNAVLSHEWRRDGYPYYIGPSLAFTWEGVFANGQKLLSWASGTWYNVEIRCELNQTSETMYHLFIKDKQNTPIFESKLPLTDSRFKILDWLGFIAYGDTDSTCYLDTIEIRLE